MKFLIVDDNEGFRTYLGELLKNRNDECVELDDGFSVSSVYNDFRPDVVLLDIVMKKVNGFEAAEKLLKEFPQSHIVFVSDYSDERFREKAKKIGVEDFISKENLFELFQVIEKINQ